MHDAQPELKKGRPLLKSMKSRVAIVTGATRGIGNAIATALAQRGGTTVVALGRSSETSAEAAARLPSPGPLQVEHHGWACDVSDPLAVQTVFQVREHSVRATGNFCPQRIKDQVGAPDILVNAAGINHDKLLFSTSVEAIDNVIDTNLRGALLTCRAVERGMLARRSGCIINIGSVIGSRGNVGQTVYAASKAGLVGLTLSLAKELGPFNVRASVLAPGFIETDMTRTLTENQRNGILDRVPLKRFGTAEVGLLLLFF